MKRSTSFIAILLLALLRPDVASAQEPTPTPTPTSPSTPTPTSPSTPTPTSVLGTTRIGGYADLQAVYRKAGADGRTRGEADVSRVVLLAQVQLAERIDAAFELEWEHARACGNGCGGIAEVEQAWADLAVVPGALLVRTGLQIVPMGLVAIHHEPTAFRGVLRPRSETEIIPSTWRDLGVSAHGTLGDSLDYQFGVLTTIDPAGMRPGGFSLARQHGDTARADAPAVAGRIDWQPLLGVIVGGSFYATDAGPNLDAANGSGDPVRFIFPLYGASLDVRARAGGLSVRGLAVAFATPESGALLRARRADGSPYFADATQPLPTRIGGAYLEAGYDFARAGVPLEPFVRVERVDPQWEVASGLRRDQTLRSTETTLGVGWSPARQIVFKADIQLDDRDRGLDERRFDLGMGLTF